MMLQIRRIVIVERGDKKRVKKCARMICVGKLRVGEIGRKETRINFDSDDNFLKSIFGLVLRG